MARAGRASAAANDTTAPSGSSNLMAMATAPPPRDAGAARQKKGAFRMRPNQTMVRAAILALGLSCSACAVEGSLKPDGHTPADGSMSSDGDGQLGGDCGLGGLDGLYNPQGCSCRAGEICLSVDRQCVVSGGGCGEGCVVGVRAQMLVRVDGVRPAQSGTYQATVTSLTSGRVLLASATGQNFEVTLPGAFETALAIGQRISVRHCLENSSFSTWEIVELSDEAGGLLIAGTGPQYMPHSSCQFSFGSITQSTSTCRPLPVTPSGVGPAGLRIPAPVTLSVGGVSSALIGVGRASEVLIDGVPYVVHLYQSYVTANSNCNDCGPGNSSLLLVKE